MSVESQREKYSFFAKTICARMSERNSAKEQQQKNVLPSVKMVLQSDVKIRF